MSSLTSPSWSLRLDEPFWNKTLQQNDVTHVAWLTSCPSLASWNGAFLDVIFIFCHILRRISLSNWFVYIFFSLKIFVFTFVVAFVSLFSLFFDCRFAFAFFSVSHFLFLLTVGNRNTWRSINHTGKIIVLCFQLVRRESARKHCKSWENHIETNKYKKHFHFGDVNELHAVQLSLNARWSSTYPAKCS